MSQIQISKRPFSEVDIDDPFFDSLRTDYKGFNGWFRRKTHELALATIPGTTCEPSST